MRDATDAQKTTPKKSGRRTTKKSSDRTKAIDGGREENRDVYTRTNTGWRVAESRY